MAARTALITGVLGQDGSLLAELLLSRGYRIVGVVKSGTVPPVIGPLAMVEFVTADLTDAAVVRELLETCRPDELYHLAAFHHSSQDNLISGALACKETMLATNFLAAKTSASALVKSAYPCHLVYAASSQMYTALTLCDEIDELSLRQPSTFYGHTKAWSVELLAFLRSESGLRASSAILFNHESTRRGPQFISRKITLAAAQAANGGHPKLALHNISARVDWSSATDVVEALSLMGKSDRPGDCIVASGVLHSVRDILEISFGHVRLDWREFAIINGDCTTPALCGHTKLLESSLGWKRRVSFEDMIAEMVEYDLGTER